MRTTTDVRQPNHGSGKTQFNRGKRKGESWVARREDAIQKGSFKMPSKNRP